MNKEKIIEYITNKKPDIDNKTLEYYTNYFCTLVNNPQVLGSENIEKLMDNALLFASKIDFYGVDSDLYKRLGPDCKGLREPKDNTIYVRDNLEEPLREITVYHELHHAVQTNPINEEVGINQEYNFGRMIMEAQTQYFAEKVYEEAHNVTFEERNIPTEELRMLPGGVIRSALHNYEMYDSLLTKLSIMLDVPKDYFVSINYQYENNQGLDNLKKVYENAKEKYKYPFTFDELMFKLDYIYVVDYIAYVENDDKNTVLSGNKTKSNYQIYSNLKAPLSQQGEMYYINEIDKECFMSLLEENGEYKDFAKYIVKNETREIISDFIGTSVGSQGL